MDAGINILRPSVDALGAARAAGAPSKKAADLHDRKTVGEFVGNIFYGTLIRQMQSSSLKSPLLRGGRGEEVFGGQMALELSKRIGESQNNPLADRIYQSILKRSGKTNAESTSKGGPAS